MRIYPSPVVVMIHKKAPLRVGTGMPLRERFRICEVPNPAHFFHIVVSLMPSRPLRPLLPLMLHDCCAVTAA
jgi:hypothetical protein